MAPPARVSPRSSPRLLCGSAHADRGSALSTPASGDTPHAASRARCRPRRLHRGVPCRRPRHEGHAGRALAESRRRVPQRGLHPFQGAAARREGDRGRRGDERSRHRVRRRPRSISRSCARGKRASSRSSPGGLEHAGQAAQGRRGARRGEVRRAECARSGQAAHPVRAMHHRRRLRADAPAGPAGRSAHHGFDGCPRACRSSMGGCWSSAAASSGSRWRVCTTRSAAR